MIDVILSIRPEHIEAMARGDKIEELRKQCPRCELPFRCRLYCSGSEDGKVRGSVIPHGAIVGEFTCGRIREYNHTDRDMLLAAARGCVTMDYLRHYFGRRATIYGLHVSALRLYKKPLTLADFGLTRPGRSWSYAKEADRA